MSEHPQDHTQANQDTWNDTNRQDVELDQEDYRGTARDEVAMDQHGYRGTTRGVVHEDRPWLKQDGEAPEEGEAREAAADGEH
ncbi:MULTISPECIES: hypothetical protein [unclassified Luteococcus]|uniref:hypothetical protein n=1 Tax=unclassified Luteococcus TaxID=2639923 RepID=UPI00313EA47F